MTKLSLSEHMPKSTGTELTAQLLKYSNSQVFDLGDIMQYFEQVLPEAELTKMKSSVDLMLAIFLENSETPHCEVKLVVSPIE